MRKRRIAQGRYELVRQLRSAADAAATEPHWPTANLDPADIVSLADTLEESDKLARKALQDARSLQSQAQLDTKAAQELMRRIDHICSSLFGPSGYQKAAFGLRPIDNERNMPPAPKAPKNVSLVDGPVPGSLLLDWRREPNSRYHVEVWNGVPEAPGSMLVKAVSETASKALIRDLAIGSKFYVRVRIQAGKRLGPWSKPLSRYVN